MECMKLPWIIAAILLWYMFPLRALGYNPLQSNCENRLLDILAETDRTDVLLLAGTCESHKGGVTSCCINGRTIVSSGFISTSMANKSCGTSIILGKAHRNARFHEPHEITGKATGRGLSQRVQSGRMDVNCIVVYFPPPPRKKTQHAHYRATCKVIATWLNQRLCETPGSCTPIVYADVNDGMGLSWANGSWVHVDTDAVSHLAARQERLAGGAGELFRQVLELHGLSSVSSWWDARPTFYGNNSQSLLDHLCWPQALLEVTISAGPLARLSRRLQLIKRRGKADHLLVHATCHYILEHSTYRELDESPQNFLLHNVDTSEVAWDMDKIMQCLTEGHRRREFIETIEKDICEVKDQLPDLTSRRTPDAVFERMYSRIIKTALQFFSTSAKEENATLDDLKHERLQMLQRRRELRSSLESTNSDAELAQVVERLDFLTKACKTQSRKIWRHKERCLLDELHENWRLRRLAQCERILKILGGRRAGPKTRNYTSLRQIMPTADQWLEQWSLPGAQGGCLRKE